MVKDIVGVSLMVIWLGIFVLGFIYMAKKNSERRRNRDL